MKRKPARADWMIPYLYIWGLQWMLDSLLRYFWMVDPHGAIRTTLLWMAAAGSVVCLLTRARRRTDRSESTGMLSWMLAIAAVGCLLLVVALLVRFDVMPLVFPELLRSLALACFYGYVGSRLGRDFVYLGVWLFVLGIVIAGWYAGYAPIVLGFSEGASLLACAVMLRLRGASESISVQAR